jgi:hypothetical protein
LEHGTQGWMVSQKFPPSQKYPPRFLIPNSRKLESFGPCNVVSIKIVVKILDQFKVQGRLTSTINN